MAAPNPKDLDNQSQTETLAVLQADADLALLVKLFEVTLKDTRSYYEHQIPAVSVSAGEGVDLRGDQIGLIVHVKSMIVRVYSRGADREAVTTQVQQLTALIANAIRNQKYNRAPFADFAQDCDVVRTGYVDAARRKGDESVEYDVEGWVEFELTVEIPRP